MIEIGPNLTNIIFVIAYLFAIVAVLFVATKF